MTSRHLGPAADLYQTRHISTAAKMWRVKTGAAHSLEIFQAWRERLPMPRPARTHLKSKDGQPSARYRLAVELIRIRSACRLAPVLAKNRFR